MCIYIYIYIYLYMPFALQLLKDWQGLGPGISLLRMLVECQITEDWTLTTRGMKLHCFGFVCSAGKEPWHAHCIIDAWVKLAKSYPSDYF